ncbi:MAG: C39 family peptidase, partial [Candidatus Rokuibacteriota bacterium]
IQLMVQYIDHGYPVMVSTNHSQTDGHIILVIGYENFDSSMSSPSVRFVCHDPYGKFNPALKSKLFGKRRFEGGTSLAEGGETGPGKGLRYDCDGIRRVRNDRHSSGTYFLVSAKLAA